LKFPYLPEADIDHAASALLMRAFGSPDQSAPFVDLEALVYDYLSEKEDLIFDDEKPLPPERGEIVLGKTIARPGKILIHSVLKDESPLGRYRFTVAHEIGHWVLHRPIMLADAQQLSLLDIPPSELVSLNRAVFPSEKQEAVLPPEEWQANRFASALLVQPALLDREFRLRFGAPPAVWDPRAGVGAPNLRFFAREFAKERVRRKSSLAEMFGLSVEAMAVTLQQRGFVTRL
jgi:hypothetical protein